MRVYGVVLTHCHLSIDFFYFYYCLILYNESNLINILEKNVKLLLTSMARAYICIYMHTCMYVCVYVVFFVTLFCATVHTCTCKCKIIHMNFHLPNHY